MWFHRNFFNWTWTYKQESDIPDPYGYLIQKKGHPVPINDPQVPNHNGTYFFKNAVLDMKLKKNLVFWAVSHCQTYSHRELYVEILKKYIPVDIFGRCGPLKCPTNGTR